MKKLFIIILIFILHSIVFSQVIEKRSKFKIGDKYGGGVIFSIDESGEHGLIASISDQAIKMMWSKAGWVFAMSLNDGDTNTNRIIKFNQNQQIFPDYTAANICDTLTIDGYSDWYLPAINELKEMYEKQKVIGNFIAWDYCSSTESTTAKCWAIHFRPNKKLIYEDKKYYRKYVVRCIRKF